MLRPLPAGLGLRDAALAEPASVAWHAISQARDVHSQSGLVIGVGPIGALYVDPVVTHEFAVSDALQAFAVAPDSATSSEVLLRF
jgi:hypothetical protein